MISARLEIRCTEKLDKFTFQWVMHFFYYRCTILLNHITKCHGLLLVIWYCCQLIYYNFRSKIIFIFLTRVSDILIWEVCRGYIERIQSCSLIWSLKTVYHFFKTIFSHLVPVCAAINFFKSPIVSSGLHLTRTFFPRRSLQVTSSIVSFSDKSPTKYEYQKRT